MANYEGVDRVIPQVISPNRDNIPEELRSLNNWIVWKAVPDAKLGKLKKVPVHHATGHAMNAQDKTNHLCFDDAWNAHLQIIGGGVGIVLTGEQVAASDNGDPLFLVGIDLDNIDATKRARSAADRVVQSVGSYTEISPSGNGIRIFVLSKIKPHSGQSPSGEMYAEKRFLTVTGYETRNTLIENTNAVCQLEAYWWPSEGVRSSVGDKLAQLSSEADQNLLGVSFLETPQNIAGVKDALSYVPPDCSYDVWRDCVWAIKSTGWDCADELATEWSRESAEHWNAHCSAQGALAKLLSSFDPERGLTLGTLYHHAAEHGYMRPTEGQLGPSDRLPSPPLLTATGAPSIKLLSRTELNALPAHRWVVRDILPETGIAAIYGPPSSGKTFIALDLASRISLGNSSWFNHHVEKRPVIYVALEGGKGTAVRLKAWDVENNETSNVLTVLDHVTLVNPEQVVALAGAISSQCEKGAVVFIDTLAQAIPGADENSGKDMRLALEAAKLIAASVGGLVVLVHHSGKDKSKGLRGHSSLHAALDAAISVERNVATGSRTWRISKMKDGEDGLFGSFELAVHQLGTDQFGGTINSCAVRERASSLFGNTETGSPTGKHQIAILKALQDEDGGTDEWSEAEVMEIAKTALADVASKHRAGRAREAIGSLIDAGHLILDDGGYSLPIAPDHRPTAPP